MRSPRGLRGCRNSRPHCLRFRFGFISGSTFGCSCWGRSPGHLRMSPPSYCTSSSSDNLCTVNTICCYKNCTNIPRHFFISKNYFCLDNSLLLCYTKVNQIEYCSILFHADKSVHLYRKGVKLIWYLN